MTFIASIIEFFVSPWFIISSLFWIFIAIAVYLLRNKKGAYTLFFPLLAMFKTKKLNSIIYKIARKNPKAWRIFWNIGIFVSFGFTIYAFYFFFTNLINLIFTPSIEQAIIPLIPGVTIDLPIFFYMLLPLLFIITTHEFAHGISASIDGVEIKSTGFLGAGFFFLVGFGAFVEVDEWELNSSKYHRYTRFRISAAGTYVNAITAGIAFLLLIGFPLMMTPLFKQVTQISNVLPLEEGGFNYGTLESGDAIDAIKKDGEPIHQYIYLDELQGITLSVILDNNTRIKCSVGENLTFKIYNPLSNLYSEKTVLLGPKYEIGIDYEYISNNQIRITYNYTNEEETNINITQINGTAINRTNGDTLEKYLTNFNLQSLNLTSDLGTNYLLDIQLSGVFIGVQSVLFWMHKNDFARLLTANFPDFIQIEFLWLFIISFSLTIFNMMPIPGFDGDRIVKEILKWIFGEKYGNTKKRRIERFIYRGDDTDCHLREYHVESVESIKIHLKGKQYDNERNEIMLGENNYKLIDSTRSGYFDTVSIILPKDTKIEDNTTFEITYNYLYDENNRKKKPLLNFIRILSVVIIVGNFILSYIKFGFNFFWI